MYYDSQKERCTDCPDKVYVSTLLLVVVFCVTIFIGIIFFLVKTKQLRGTFTKVSGRFTLRRIKGALQMVTRQVGSIGFQATLKILITFGQEVAFIPKIFDLKTSEDLELFDVEEQGYMKFWESVSRIGGIDFRAMLPCQTFLEQLLWVAATPVAQAVFLLVLGTVLQYKTSSSKSGALTLRQHLLLGGVPPMLLVMYVSVPVVSFKLFSSFNCISYEYDSDAGIEKRFMMDSPEILCDESPEHTHIRHTAVALIFVWP